MKKVFYKNYKNNTTTWKPGTIKDRIGNMIYSVQGKKFIYRRHINQLQKRITDEPTETPQIEEDDLQDLYDILKCTKKKKLVKNIEKQF